MLAPEACIALGLRGRSCLSWHQAAAAAFGAQRTMAARTAMELTNGSLLTDPRTTAQRCSAVTVE